MPNPKLKTAGDDDLTFPSEWNDPNHYVLSEHEIKKAFMFVVGIVPREADMALLMQFGSTPQDVAEYLWDHWMGEPDEPTVEEVEGMINQIIDRRTSRVARNTVRCPNCGTDDIETEVCPHCNKPLSVEWRKLEGESPYYDSPPQHQHESPFWSEPNRVDKPQAERVDNSYPSVVSHTVGDEEFWGNPEPLSGGVSRNEFL